MPKLLINVAIILTFFNVIVWNSAAEALCPINNISFSFGFDCRSTHFFVEPAISEGCFEQGSHDAARAGYDLLAGIIDCSSSAFFEDGRANSSVLAQDVYRIEGVADSSVIDFEVLLHLVTFATDLSFACALLSEGIDNQIVHCTEPGRFQTSISIPLAHSPGQDFQLLYQLSSEARNAGGASINATLEFSGLPAGASIVSCQGYFFDSPVQTLSKSWGRVKAIYR